MSNAAYSIQSSALFSQFEEDTTFRRVFTIALLCLFVSGIIFPYLPVPEPTRESLEKLPPQMARVIIPKKPKPKPKIVKPEPVKPKVEKKVEKKIEKKPPKPKPQPVKKEVKKPAPEKVKKAREKAKQSGLVAMRDELSSLREMVALPTTVTPTKKVDPANLNDAAKSNRRDVLSAKAKQSSGAQGRKQAARQATTGTLTAMAATEVTAPETAADRGQLVNEGEQVAKQTLAKNSTPIRDEESIRRTFERNKSAIFSLYNRALRKNSSLQGKVTIELEISPDGKVIACNLITSEIGDPKLERKIITRVKMLDFGPQNVAAIKFEYTFDFLPS